MTLADAIVPGYGPRPFRPVVLTGLGRHLTPFPRLYVLEQSRNEAILAGALDQSGRPVQWNTDLLSLQVPDDAPEPDGPRTVRARYCIAADGAASPIRESLGIPFTGTTNPFTYFVADAVGVTGVTAARMNRRITRDDFLLTFPMGPGGRQRLLGVIQNEHHTDEGLMETQVRHRLEDAFGVGQLYLVRRDGFIAAEACPEEALALFRRQLPWEPSSA